MFLELIIPQIGKHMYIRASPTVSGKDVSKRLSDILRVDIGAITMIHINDSKILSDEIPLINQGIRGGERILICMDLL